MAGQDHPVLRPEKPNTDSFAELPSHRRLPGENGIYVDVKAEGMTELSVDGMACSGCVDTVVEALEDVPGVESADADHEAGTASVTGDADVDALVRAVEDAGYEAHA